MFMPIIEIFYNLQPEEDLPDSRKVIRQVMTGRKLQEATKVAAKAEKERRDRVKELRKKVGHLRVEIRYKICTFSQFTAIDTR